MVPLKEQVPVGLEVTGNVPLAGRCLYGVELAKMAKTHRRPPLRTGLDVDVRLFLDRIKAQWEALGTTRAKFFQALGLNDRYFSKAYTPKSTVKRLPNTETLMAMAVGLDRLVDELIAGLNAEYDTMRQRRLLTLTSPVTTVESNTVETIDPEGGGDVMQRLFDEQPELLEVLGALRRIRNEGDRLAACDRALDAIRRPPRHRSGDPSTGRGLP
jgi:hypothetical protein